MKQQTLDLHTLESKESRFPPKANEFFKQKLPLTVIGLIYLNQTSLVEVITGVISQFSMFNRGIHAFFETFKGLKTT